MLLSVLVKTFVLYFVILIVYRILGKKELGQLSIVDLIVSILIAELAAISISTNESIWHSIGPILIIMVLEFSLSYISMKNNKIRNLIEGVPSVIIKDGKVRFKEMHKLRYNLDDLMSQLREQGIRSIEEVRYAVLENNGKLSVFQDGKDYPMPVILDGVIDKMVLKEINKTEFWINNILKDKKLNLEDVFYAFYTNNRLFIIKRSDLI